MSADLRLNASPDDDDRDDVGVEGVVGECVLLRSLLINNIITFNLVTVLVSVDQ